MNDLKTVTRGNISFNTSFVQGNTTNNQKNGSNLYIHRAEEGYLRPVTGYPVQHIHCSKVNYNLYSVINGEFLPLIHPLSRSLKMRVILHIRLHLYKNTKFSE